MLSAAEIDRVRAEHRLLDVLARAGIDPPPGWNGSRSFMISCPTSGHDDSTPSMMINPERDRYHCFGCGSHGDVLQLVMDLEGIRSLTTAATVLDSRRSIRSFTSSPTPRAAEGQSSERVRPSASLQLDRSTGLPTASVEAPNLVRTSADRILELNEQAWRYLTAPRLAERARTYLGERGIELDALETEAGRALAGHTPSSSTGLSEHLVRHGFTLDELVDAGWLSRWRSGRLLDRYRHRVLIPARDRLDRLVGVYARDVTGRSSAKYLNTPETLVFKKRELLYRPTTWELAPEGSVVVCEGSLDALAIAAAAASIGRSRR
ncbi:MAG TPA: CHC2 zinc finger domain-containing protein, partial [Acidimicrobiales bacterium]|nr:CHC2 zinc finger domain-containing protein [Acidimicrobiales bacterium]